MRLRPVLVSSRLEDPVQKMRWIGDHWSRVGGSQASVEVGRREHVHRGLAAQRGPGWRCCSAGVLIEGAYTDVPHADPGAVPDADRDLLASGDVGFWQAAIRDTAEPGYAGLSRAIPEMQPFTLELLYGDHEGGQRTITRFGLVAARIGDGDDLRWFPSTERHWPLDRPDPR